MSKRETLRDVALIALASLLVRWLTAQIAEQPGYMDAYYYFHVARNLANGQGFVENILWNYLDNPAGLPHASNLYWMPLTSVLVAPGLALLGDTFRAAQAPLVLISPLVPLIAYASARLLLGGAGTVPERPESASRQERGDGIEQPSGDVPLGLPAVGPTGHWLEFARQQWLAVVLLTLFSGVYFVYWTMPDSFASFAIPGALSLLCMGLGLERSPRWFLPAAVCVALAHLARPDGVLLLGVLLAAILVRFWPGRAARTAGWSVAVIVVYLVVLGPWLARNVAVSGSIAPGSTEALFQREYNDLYRYGRTLTPAYYLEWGWQNIIGSKVQAAGENLLIFAELFQFYLLPFGLLGIWHWRRRPAAWPFLAYGALLYAAMSLLFTFAGPRGSYLHSMVALLPFYSVAIVKGIEVAVHWMAGRLKHWLEPTAQRNFLGIAVGIAAVASVALALMAVGRWRDQYAAYSNVAAWLASHGAGSATVMVVDPPGWYYVSGHQAIAAPNEELATVVEVCRRYGARYLLLEAAHPLGLHQLFLGSQSDPALAQLASVSGIQIYQVVVSGGSPGG